MLAELRDPKGNPPELALTSNGALLTRKAHLLRSAGLDRITVSLDAIDDAIFRKMNDVDFPVEQVFDGIRAAEEAGFRSLKINMVVQRGLNASQILPMVEYFRHRGHVLRFIEFMDVGSSNGWNLDAVVPSAEILRQISSVYRLRPLEAQYAGEVAERWMLNDGSLEIGLISSVTAPFCAACTRARVSTEGRLYTCLFASEGWDLRALLRTGASDEAIYESLRQVWALRSDRYSELRTFVTREAPVERRIEMSYIGG
jgi:cyclic pyranopterin phosphate synthase